MNSEELEVAIAEAPKIAKDLEKECEDLEAEFEEARRECKSAYTQIERLEKLK